MALNVFRRKGRILLLALVLTAALLVWKWGNVSKRKVDSVKSKAANPLPAFSASAKPGLSPMLKQLDANATIVRSYTLDGMRKQALKLNLIQKMKNTEKFGDHRADDPVIVIQAHDRPEMLKKLLYSLRYARGIESSTLVISRDKFSLEMDAVLDKDIDFCRYIEIFCPFSMQLYPDQFPGGDHNDCPRDLSKQQARERGCNNAEFPDMYGHYREVGVVQIKHHWFWKLNMVFSGMREIHKNVGPVLFLEEDNYVSPDLIHIMKKAVSLRDKNCQHCHAITLGAYDFSSDYASKGNKADAKPWVSSQHNIGMVIFDLLYDQLVKCTDYFCTYDDYNWDWTLQSTAAKCLPSHLHTLVLNIPRVYHLGCTGFHQKQHGICDINEEEQKLRKVFESQAAHLFPNSLELMSNNQAVNSNHVPNGGWGDIRDQELCKTYTDLCKKMISVA